MGGKKWCEYCRINIAYNKKDIQEHQQTRMHLANKQKTIKFERMKIQQQQKSKRQQQKQNAFLSSANIPKAKKGSQLEKQVQGYRDYVINNGKSAIHQLIAQRTKGLYGAPIQYPDKEDLVLAENYESQNKNKGDNSDDDSSQQYEMWKLDICEQTGNPCFINAITKAKYYEPPKGYIMSQSKKQQWQYLQQICKQKQNNEDNQVNISQWQQVPQQQNYFFVNKVAQQAQNQSKQKNNVNVKRGTLSLSNDELIKEQQQQKKKNWIQQLQQKINNNEIDGNEVMQTVIYNKLLLCKNVKERNETLKRLIKNDIEIRQTLDEHIKKDDLLEEKQKIAVAFKSKKKIKTSTFQQLDV